MQSLKIISSAVSALCMVGTPLIAQSSVAHSSMWLQAPTKSATSVTFSCDADINTSAIPEQPILWGMDVAWDSEANVLRGTNFIGKDVMRIGRISFQPSDLVDADGNLSMSQQRALQSRLDHIALSGVKDVILNCDHEKLNTANYSGKPYQWYRVIKASVMYARSKGFNVITVSPFNEPDLDAWKEGPQSEFKEIARYISEDPDLKGVRISAGNTLNCDAALSWYNGVKPYVTEGNTHQLAGSFDTYADFWTTVRRDGNHATADELHNVMEAFVGIHYGMQSGVWWGYDAAARGEFCRASFYGREIGYAENRAAWSAATVYKRADGRIDAFLGTSERQAVTSSYEFTSLDRPVFYDGYGPAYSYPMEMPGGTGYQKGQTNAERMIRIYSGEDVPVEPIVAGTYVIVNRNSLMAMGFNNGASAEGTPITQSKYTGEKPNTHQQWVIEPVSSRIGGDFGYFVLRSKRNEKQVIDVRDWSLEPGGSLIGFTGGLGANEQWFVEYAGDGDYYIRSRHSGLYLEVYNSSKFVGGKIQQAAFTGNANQRWRFMPADAALDDVAPSAPEGLMCKSQSASVALSWKPSDAGDVAGYMVLRKKKGADDSQWDVIGRMVADPLFIDNDCQPSTDYVYKVKAIDRSRNLSVASAVAEGRTAEDKALIARYTFEEHTADQTANTFDAVVPSSTSYNSLAKREGNASIKFDGTSSYLRLPAAVTHHRQLTVAMWVSSLNVTSAWTRIFDFGNGTDQYMFLTPSNGSEMRFVMKNRGEEQILRASSLIAGWHHVAVTIGDDAVCLYVDGVEAARSTSMTLRPSDLNTVVNYVGRSQFAADPLFKGYVDDLRIYNYPLSASDIESIYKGNDDTSAILEVGKAVNVVSETVFTLDGKAISSAAVGKGIYIVRQQMSDGSVRIIKRSVR